MTILVDEPVQYPEYMVSAEARSRGHSRKSWAHMTSDSSHEELHAFAFRLGLKREWFQGDHYDLTEGMQKRALALGAVLVDGAELFKRNCFGRKNG